jgi:N-methylhydantoinase A
MSLQESEDGAGPDASGAIDRHEEVYFDGEWMETPIYTRDKLRPGNDVPGPAIVVQVDTTTVVEPGYKGSVDSYGNILIEEA